MPERCEHTHRWTEPPRRPRVQKKLGTGEDPLPIIFLTGQGDIPMSVRAMRAGAVDFLTKPVKRDALLNAVRAALATHIERRAERDRLQDVRIRFDTLTSREREVFGRVVAGMLNKQIAADLGCSIRTVKIHRARTMEKMQVDSLADLVRLAEMLRPPDSHNTAKPSTDS